MQLRQDVAGRDRPHVHQAGKRFDHAQRAGHDRIGEVAGAKTLDVAVVALQRQHRRSVVQGHLGGDMRVATAEGLVPEHAIDIGSGVLKGVGDLGEFE